jgi:phenylalanyl-tRNA synthetase alpha chain
MQALSAAELAGALALRDLTDPASGPHAMQRLVDAIQAAVATRYECTVQRLRASPVVRVERNHDALGYPPDGAARDARHSHYLDAEWMLRTHTTAGVPDWLESWHDRTPRRLALLAPGLVYRRDAIDRLHVGAPHQVDVWVLVPRGDALDGPGLVDEAIATIVGAALPDHVVDPVASRHPYTVEGEQLDVIGQHGQRIEIGECGRIAPELLERTGWDPDRVTGIAMGLGLDRLLMLRKGIPDIRLLRDADARVQLQMQTLEPWAPVSSQPPIHRDLSIATDADTDGALLGDQVRTALADVLPWLESVAVVEETPCEQLPRSALERLGMGAGMKNVLLRLTIRHPTRSVTRREANELRNRVWRATHQGTRAALAE